MNVYSIVTERILSTMAKGIIPWKRPWANMEFPKNYINRNQYRGINLFLLNMAEYASPYWLTFKQCRDCKGQIKKGEQATPVVYFTMIDKTDNTDNNADDKKNKQVPVLRYYSVFNLSQTTLVDTESIKKPVNPIATCEQVINDMPLCPKIYYGGNKAYYSADKDYIRLPAPPQFATVENFYEVLWHECVHSTGHSSRLNRPGITNHSSFGTELYSFEEMTAEFGAAYLCGHAGIDRQTTDSSAGYIQNWMQAIKADNKLLIKAASAAQKAVDFILNHKGAE